MAENETKAAPETSAEPTGAATSESTPPLTIDAIKEALLPEIGKSLKAAYDAARRAEAKAERVPERFREFVAPLEEAVETLLTRDMSDDAREAFKAKRDLARATRPDPAAEQRREIEAFQAEAASVLEEEGIGLEDEILAAAYKRYVAGARSPAQWRTALGRAIAAVHRDRASKAETGVTERERKAREDERTKILNEAREKEGPIDRGQPASANAKIDWMNLSPEEFARLDAAKTAERRARAAGMVRR